MRRIVTSYWCKPTPTRSLDWCAYYDGDEEAGQYGFGSTEEEAVADFIENWQELCNARLDRPDADFLRDRQQDEEMRGRDC
jgi:hypothetical protein